MTIFTIKYGFFTEVVIFKKPLKTINMSADIPKLGWLKNTQIEICNV